ncbi:MAG: diguanylate cyclase [Burkholderiales bacterium]|nr:diguanylate cyclase [Burkholderiales bacterium]
MSLARVSADDQQLQLERVKIFFAHSVNNLPALLVGAVLVAAVLRFSGAPLKAVGAITVLMLVCTAGVAALAFHVRRTGLSSSNCMRLLRTHVSLALTMALIYGLSVFLIPGLNTHAEHTLLFLLFSTAVATIALGYSVYPPYYLAAGVLCLAPMTGRFLYLFFEHNDRFFLLLFFASLIWQVVVISKTLLVSKTVIRNISLNQQLQQEVEENTRTREAISHMAMHDELTDLANRRYFEQIFARTLSQAERAKESFGILSVDLNDFKPVNDTYGHAIGDHLLKIVAERLGRTTRASDFCARVGGDEFAVLCTSIKSSADLQDITYKLKLELGKPFELDDNLVNTSASIGWALYPEDGDNLTRLLACADRRMYADKQTYKKNRPAALI